MKITITLHFKTKSNSATKQLHVCLVALEGHYAAWVEAKAMAGYDSDKEARTLVHILRSPQGPLTESVLMGNLTPFKVVTIFKRKRQ